MMRLGGFALFVCATGTLSAAEPVDFAHDVVPVLKTHCVECHGGEKSEGGFSLNSRELVLDAGVVEPGEAEQSRLLELVTSTDEDEQMPPADRERVPAKDIEVLQRWIDEGLRWEEGFTFAEPVYEPPLHPRRPELPPVVDGRTNPIDRILDAYLTEHELDWPQPLDDAAFLRRVSLDLVGRLPTPEELQQFSLDSSPDKRTALIDALLSDRQAYAGHWMTFWNDLLRNDYAGTGYIDGGRKQITGWLYRALYENKPYDQFLTELIAPGPESEGFIRGIKWRGNVNASQTREVQFAQNVAQVFLGMNLKCASCHDSFIDRWTLEEAYGLAAVYAESPLEIHRCDKPTGQHARAAWIFPELGTIDANAPPAERLRALADLLTHPENGRTTRTIVNRLWHRLMGRGIVHPVDAMQTEPWSADLLDYLAIHLRDSQFDLKETLRLIATSRAYQSQSVVQTTEPVPGEYVWAGPIARRMTAEQFVDAIWQITDTAPARVSASLPPRPEVLAEITVQGKWIWSEAGGNRPAGEVRVFRHEFELAARPEFAEAVITCDNEYKLSVNGREVGADKNWGNVENYPLEPHLKAGANVIEIGGRNAGDGPNPAGLFFEARLQTGDEETIIASDADWTVSVPDSDASKAAVVLDNQQFLGPGINDQIRVALARAADAMRRTVRASLMRSDLLMRGLGRPNREQVVTTRPTDLTTLQAIDLSNGEILAGLLRRGAGNLLGSRDADELIDWVYRFALSRFPTDEERTIAAALVGQQNRQQGLEDFLWSVFMLPEFQLIR